MTTKQKATRVQWNDEEWNLVCSELHNRYPIESSSSTLAGIKSDDVVAAMHKVLPQNRWRASVNMTAVRPRLLKQFSTLRRVFAKRDAEAAAAKASAEKEDNDRAKGALEPLAELLAERLFVHLRPMIDNYLQEQVRVISAQSDTWSALKTKAEALNIPKKDRVAEREYRMKVGIIGLLPIQANSLAADFPNMDFTFTKGDNSNEVREKMANMDAVFGLTAKMGHNVEQVLKKMPVWGQYRRVGGKGTSAVKNAVRIWSGA